jgi:2,3-bisphosphoglycerate-independent phosphoglycerate mutase
MVGHTAVPGAIFKAVETVDACLSEIVPVVLENDGIVLVTADHGNAEQMVDKNGEPLTSHTTNLVPFILVGRNYAGCAGVLKSVDGRLCDVAPTMLSLLGLEKPREMTGISLID